MIFFLGNYPVSGKNLKTNVSGLTVCPIIRRRVITKKEDHFNTMNHGESLKFNMR